MGMIIKQMQIIKELLIVSNTLEWCPLTTLITRRLGMKTHLYSEFLSRCQCLLLFVDSDTPCFLSFRMTPPGRFRLKLAETCNKLCSVGTAISPTALYVSPAHLAPSLWSSHPSNSVVYPLSPYSASPPAAYPPQTLPTNISLSSTSMFTTATNLTLSSPTLPTNISLPPPLYLPPPQTLPYYPPKEEQQAHVLNRCILETDSAISVARSEAVEWMLKVNAHYGFSALSAILSINYLDRFLASHHVQRDNKPWMIQLVAVACLSLAAKVEETQVPLLLDLQVEDAQFVFEAKTIQRMELLVLSTLQWKMHPVTPLSFLEHITRRLGMKTHLHWEFLRRCERLLLSVVSDQVEPCNPTEYQNQLLGILKISEEKVNACYNLILELSNAYNCVHNNPLKRKYEQIPCSPSGVIDAVFSSDSSNDSWAVGLSVYSSPEPPFKKSRAHEQQMKLPSLNRISVGIVGSPP
ncbi:hypothetical protein FH972_004560 [Carpinus fangiana]|uniref:B-like cyclin n=1 Tax=Carpinus fangiana TaxID=176857 RepID=A0A5N6QP03_9ROSI|nr:hypothetical protein FH972_004560 [Carpinus fangiana]